MFVLVQYLDELIGSDDPEKVEPPDDKESREQQRR